jgi:mono/diheme cytochrome c family protein
MKMRWRALMAAAAVTLVTAAPCAQGNAQNGKDLYLRYSCYACHGYAGHGGAGPRLVPMRAALAGFTSIVRNPPTMPPYTAKVLTDAHLADIWAYIKTLPPSPSAKDIPLLNQWARTEGPMRGLAAAARVGSSRRRTTLPASSR